MTRPIHVTRLEDRGDDRGSSFAFPNAAIPFQFMVKDIHVTTILPGHTRGNHYHAKRTELFIVYHRDRWSVHWDCGVDTAASSDHVTGTGVTLLEVSQGCSHAIRNDGTEPMLVIGLADVPYDPANPDTIPRQVV